MVKKIHPKIQKLNDKAVKSAAKARKKITVTVEGDEPEEVSVDGSIKVIPEVCVFYDRERHTCIRVKIGNRGTAFIPMDAEGIVVCWRQTEVFDALWTPLPLYNIREAASKYIQSSPASFGFISAEAHTLLMEILSQGGTRNRDEKELEIMAAKNKKVPPTAGTTKGKGKGKTTTKKDAAPAKNAPAKPKVAGEKKRPREDSKMGKLLVTLEKGKGVSLDALSDASGYDLNNTRTAIGILRSKNGFKIEFDKDSKLYTLGK